MKEGQMFLVLIDCNTWPSEMKTLRKNKLRATIMNTELN